MAENEVQADVDWTDMDLMDVKPELEEGNPLVEKLGLCVKECPSFSRLEAKGESPSAVLCSAKGEPTQVAFRSVCMPWVQILLDGLKRSQGLLQAVNDQNAIMAGEVRAMEADGVKIRSELGRYDVEAKRWEKEKEDAARQIEEAKKDKSDMWMELRAVQEFRAEKKKFDKQLADTVEDFKAASELRSKANDRLIELETSNRDLRNRTLSLEQINEDLERKAKQWKTTRAKLKGEIAQLEASIAKQTDNPVTKESADG